MDLVDFVDNIYNKRIRAVLEPAGIKRKVNHRKYLQRQLQRSISESSMATAPATVPVAAESKTVERRNSAPPKPSPGFVSSTPTRNTVPRRLTQSWAGVSEHQRANMFEFSFSRPKPAKASKGKKSQQQQQDQSASPMAQSPAPSPTPLAAAPAQQPYMVVFMVTPQQQQQQQQQLQPEAPQTLALPMSQGASPFVAYHGHPQQRPESPFSDEEVEEIQRHVQMQFGLPAAPAPASVLAATPENLRMLNLLHPVPPMVVEEPEDAVAAYQNVHDMVSVATYSPAPTATTLADDEDDLVPCYFDQVGGDVMDLCPLTQSLEARLIREVLSDGDMFVGN